MKKETAKEIRVSVPKHWVNVEPKDPTEAFQFMISEGFFSPDEGAENYAGNYTYKGTLPEGTGYNGKKYFSLMFMNTKDKIYFK